MTGLLTSGGDRRSRISIRIWLLVALAVAAVMAANAHLIYVAVMSEPACVDHLRPGDANREQGRFSAAQSSCNAGNKP
jgi:hypothetical protein